MRPIKRKGDATDPLVIMVILLFLAISFIVVIYMNTIVRGVIANTDLGKTTSAPSILNAFDNVNAHVVQRGFVLMFAIMCIFMIASAFMVRVHPVFIFLYIITLMVTLFSGVYLANLYGTLEDNPILMATFQSQPMINYIMEHLVIITMALGGISMLVIFSKIFSAPVASRGF